MQPQGYSVKWKSMSTQAHEAQIRCNFYSIEVGAKDLATTLYPGSLSFSSNDNRGKGEKCWV